jgi:hypothetical protein
MHQGIILFKHRNGGLAADKLKGSHCPFLKPQRIYPQGSIIIPRSLEGGIQKCSKHSRRHYLEYHQIYIVYRNEPCSNSQAQTDTQCKPKPKYNAVYNKSGMQPVSYAPYYFYQLFVNRAHKYRSFIYYILIPRSLFPSSPGPQKTEYAFPYRVYPCSRQCKQHCRQYCIKYYITKPRTYRLHSIGIPT